LPNEYLLSVILGVIEGLTEFLPVSSTAHLRLAQALFHVPMDDRYWQMYTVVIQFGAIAALPIFFFRRIIKFVRTFPKGELGDSSYLTHPLSLTILAFIMTAVPALLLKKIIGENLANLSVIGASLLLGGVVMWVVDIMWTRPRTLYMEEISPLQAIWIGLCQVISAVFPGTSRSMATIAGGQIAGLSRTAALEFSFFLSMPTMAAAAVNELWSTIHSKHSDQPMAPLHVDAKGWIILLIGTVVSFLVSLGVIAWFMAWVRKRGFTPFAIYRIIVGIAVLLWARHLATAP
jgi:undecaprenyl-diphosphatase